MRPKLRRCYVTESILFLLIRKQEKETDSSETNLCLNRVKFLISIGCLGAALACELSILERDLYANKSHQRFECDEDSSAKFPLP